MEELQKNGGDVTVVVVLFIFILLGVSLPVLAQERVEIPFTTDKSNQHVIVKLSMNGQEGRFIVDTGSTWTVADAKYLNLTVELRRSQFENVGLRGEAMEYAVVLEVIGKRLRQTIAVMDLTELSKQYKFKIDGIIGQGFLRRYDNVLFVLSKQ